MCCTAASNTDDIILEYDLYQHPEFDSLYTAIAAQQNV